MTHAINTLCHVTGANDLFFYARIVGYRNLQSDATHFQMLHGPIVVQMVVGRGK